MKLEGIAGIAIPAALLAGFAASAEAPQAAGLSGAQWLAPGADLVAALTRSPGECLKPAENAETAYLVEVGRAAFRSPLLFGGPAARSGLSCNSCHLDGHDNPQFFVPGLSGDPGTADVTSSLFSKVREDHVFNPVAIPTLVDAGKKTSFGTTSPQPSIEAFTISAVKDEFQGAPPPRAIIDGVGAYVRHLAAEACPGKPARRDLDRALGDVARTVAAAKAALERGDGASADFLILSARQASGLVYERFAGSDFGVERAALIGFSRDLGEARRLAADDPAAGLAALEAAGGELPELARRLGKSEKKSLFNEKVLRRALETRKK
jgi:hypothetical protein